MITIACDAVTDVAILNRVWLIGIEGYCKLDRKKLNKNEQEIDQDREEDFERNISRNILRQR